MPQTTNKHIISIDDIKLYRPMAELDAERVNPYILEAQRHDLRPVLGDALFFDFMKYFDNVDAQYDKYRELLRGKEYTYNGQLTQYDGLVEMVVFFTLARFLPNNIQHITRFSVTKKVDPGNRSEVITPEEVRATVSEYRSNAVFFIPKVREFLQTNQATYTLYNVTPVPNLNQGGMKFFDL